MKYLNKLFAFDARPTHRHQLSHQHQSSATLTSTLYSIIFIPESTAAAANQSQAAAAAAARRKQSELRQESNNWRRSRRRRREEEEEAEKKEKDKVTAARGGAECGSGLGGFLLTATIGKTIASTSALVPSEEQQQQQNTVDIESDKLDTDSDDWILINVNNKQQQNQQNNQTNTHPHHNQVDAKSVNINYIKEQVYFDYQQLDHDQDYDYYKEEEEVEEEEEYENIITQSIHQMALDANDVELIKASWIPVRKNPNDSGVLLFRGLFTKFPQYLQMFPQFTDLDIDHMHENKRLLKHAVKVIETVTFVVDSIGDESKTSLLQSALVNLVRGHLKRKIGLTEFRNLGIVLIDFICDVNNRRHLFISSSTSSSDVITNRNSSNTFNRHLLNKSTSDSSQSNDSETMTSALDKIRASTSPSSSPEEESYLVANSNTINNNNNNNKNNNNNINLIAGDERKNHSIHEDDSSDLKSGLEKKNDAKIDTNVLVAAWTKLYSGILDLVKSEEESQQKSS